MLTGDDLTDFFLDRDGERVELRLPPNATVVYLDGLALLPLDAAKLGRALIEYSDTAMDRLYHANMMENTDDA